MEISESIESSLLTMQRLFRIGYCLFPTLFGLFMIFWGIFISHGDWILIAIGLLIFLLFGRALYRAITGRLND